MPLGDRDFRIKPDEGILEPATGRTQHGRVRDDWGNWFGCDNSNLCWHYPLADHYLRRNPHAAPPGAAVNVADYPNGNRLYPVTQLQLFQLSGPPGLTTAACGLGVYRDDLLGAEYRGNTFTCEAVNLLVHRLRLAPRGSSFSGRRADDEQQSEFLASRDNWFRPVQARTGPDGCLWVVDMYRYVIEHPRWIPPADLAKLDVRAGHDMGRLYRIRPTDREPRPWPRLDKLDTAGLVAALDSPNGWQRDLASQLLLWNNDPAARRPLVRLVRTGTRPEARLHALCVLGALVGQAVPDGGSPRQAQPDLQELQTAVSRALADPHPGVRRHAVRLTERILPQRLTLGPSLLRMLDDPDAQVRLQLAFTLGQWQSTDAGRALGTLARRHADDPYLTAAVFSSLNASNVAEALAGALEDGTKASPPERLVQRLLGVAAALADQPTLAKVLRQVAEPRDGRFAPWQFAALAGVADALQRRGQALAQFADDDVQKSIARLLAEARKTAVDDRAAGAARLAAVGALGRESRQRDDDLALLGKLLVPQNPAAVQGAAAEALGRIPDDRAAARLTAGWAGYAPALRGQVLDLLQSRDAWQRHLLAAVEKNEVAAADLDLARRRRLLEHKDAAVRERAARLFAGAIRPDRQKVLDEYRDVVSMPGDRIRGKAVFAKSCSTCHVLENVGHDVGPNLAATFNKSPGYLLQEILDPNRNIDSRSVEYVAITKAGLTYTGLLASESATSITLEGPEAKQQVLLRADLDELRSTGKSLMPEGLEKDLSKQALADVIAYLTAIGPPPKRFAGNTPAVVKPVRGALALLATNGEIYGGAIIFEPPFHNVGNWHGATDHVVWRVELDKSGEFDVWLDWACDNAVAGNRYVLEGAEPTLHGTVMGTGGWDRYRQQKIGTVTLVAGSHHLTLRPDAEKVNGALLDLRGLHLVPKGQQPMFAQAETKADPKELARQILDDKRPGGEREAIIRAHLDKAADLVAALTADLKPGTPEEYRRIPWIWRVAVAAGRRNDADQLRRLLDVSLPKYGEPLRDWQAVVVGGGVINGISQQGVWPLERLLEILKGQGMLGLRMQLSLRQAVAMADNEKVPTGTRYDALRMIALDTWKRSGEQLTKYLAKGTHDELQMGAISGLADMDVPQVAPLLLAGLGHFSAGNRNLALDVLLRTAARTTALLEALEQGKVKRELLGERHAKALRVLKDDALRARALKLLPPG